MNPNPFSEILDPSLLLSKIHPLSYIRIYHESEGWIKTSILRITVWHHEACRVMTKVDLKDQIFLAAPNTNDGSPLNSAFFSLKQIS